MKWRRIPGCSTTECLRLSIFVNVIGRMCVYISFRLCHHDPHVALFVSYVCPITNCQLERFCSKRYPEADIFIRTATQYRFYWRWSSILVAEFKGCELNFNRACVQHSNSPRNGTLEFWYFFFFFYYDLDRFPFLFCGLDKWNRDIAG